MSSERTSRAPGRRGLRSALAAYGDASTTTASRTQAQGAAAAPPTLGSPFKRVDSSGRAKRCLRMRPGPFAFVSLPCAFSAAGGVSRPMALTLRSHFIWIGLAMHAGGFRTLRCGAPRLKVRPLLWLQRLGRQALRWLRF